MAKYVFNLAKKRSPEIKGGRYTYRTYELKRQVKLGLFFRKIRLFYIVFCIIFLLATYPYLNFSWSVAAGPTIAALVYGIVRALRESAEDPKRHAIFWPDLIDYFFIAFLVYITGGTSSFYFVAYVIPIMAGTIRFNIKVGMCGFGLAIVLTGANVLIGNSLPGARLPISFYLLFALGTMAFAVWTISGLIGDELKLRKELYNFSVTDPMTGLFHRGYARERIHEEILRCRRSGGSFSVIFIDLDHFKEVNDRYGHLTGDEVVRHVSAVLQGIVRGGDTLSRYGGDEFLVLLPGSRLEEAELILQRLLQAIESQPYYINGRPLKLSLSAGAAEYPSEGQRLEQLLQVADQKMYSKKG